jgi:GNAT superfamily N-acetyltransferase
MNATTIRVDRRSGLELSKWQMRDLSLLNLPDGSMWPELVARRRDKRECTVYLAREPEHARIVAWALTYPTPNLGGHDFHVYVRDLYRREGYGTALYRAAVADVGTVRMFAPDDTARNFHASLDNRNRTR